MPKTEFRTIKNINKQIILVYQNMAQQHISFQSKKPATQQQEEILTEDEAFEQMSVQQMLELPLNIKVKADQVLGEKKNLLLNTIGWPDQKRQFLEVVISESVKNPGRVFIRVGSGSDGWLCWASLYPGLKDQQKRDLHKKYDTYKLLHTF